MDYERTDRQEAGRILGVWLVEGNTIEPRFAGTWSETVERCTCDASPNIAGQTAAPKTENLNP